MRNRLPFLKIFSFLVLLIIVVTAIIISSFCLQAENRHTRPPNAHAPYLERPTTRQMKSSTFCFFQNTRRGGFCPPTLCAFSLYSFISTFPRKASREPILELENDDALLASAKTRPPSAYAS